MLFNVFTNSLDSWMEYTLHGFVGVTELWGAINIFACRSVRKRSDRNIRKLDKGECKVLYLGLSNCMSQYRGSNG